MRHGNILDNSLHKSDNSVIAITELEETPQSVITITETGQIDIYHAMTIPNTADFPGRWSSWLCRLRTIQEL